ncbi:hypothetical protein [Phreatobacter sp.]|uniref:hypothetical protein n=1 Tax=Phreatobacter sp. TaxID=1966341 RepID=UPI003F706723
MIRLAPPVAPMGFPVRRLDAETAALVADFVARRGVTRVAATPVGPLEVTYRPGRPGLDGTQAPVAEARRGTVTVTISQADARILALLLAEAAAGRPAPDYAAAMAHGHASLALPSRANQALAKLRSKLAPLGAELMVTGIPGGRNRRLQLTLKGRV